MANQFRIVKRQWVRPRFGWLVVSLLLLALLGSSPSAAAEKLPIDVIVSKMTSRAVFKLRPQKVRAYFRDVCQLDSKGPGKYLWVYDNRKPGRGLVWLRVELQPGAEGGTDWVLLQSQVALPLRTAAYPNVYATLKKTIGKRLGRPEFQNEKSRDKMVSWSLGHDRSVVLRQGRVDDPYRNTTASLVLLESVIMQGED